MGSGGGDAFTSPWPADPVSAWTDAASAPRHLIRHDDPPMIGSLDDVAARVRQRSSLLPMFALVFTVTGAILVAGLTVGVFPLSREGGAPVEVQWIGGVALLVAGLVVWSAHLWWTRAEQKRPYPPAQGALCELYPSNFDIPDGDGYCSTVLAIDTRTADDQAAKIALAFSIWQERLASDSDAASEARSTWVKGGGKAIANVYGSEEFFGPEASGGYLVRPSSRRARWALLLTARPPKDPKHPLRSAKVLAARSELRRLDR